MVNGGNHQLTHIHFLDWNLYSKAVMKMRIKGLCPQRQLLASLILLLLSAFCNSQTCVTPLGENGECVQYNECPNLSEFREKYNLRNRGDLLKLLCSNTKDKGPIICCTVRKNSYYSGYGYESNLNKSGVEILESLRCGIPSGDRIAGGTNGVLGRFPFMALLRYNYSDPFRCSGSLITNRYVLTAAHCINEELIGVRLGEHNLSNDEDCITVGRRRLCLPPVEDFGIEYSIGHPSYSPRTMSHDIALVKLDQDVVFKKHIKPICLPTQAYTIESVENPVYTIAGWGKTENGKRSDVLQVANIPHRDRNVCKKVFAMIPITYSHICAGGEEQIDSCKGDSGGPLFTLAPYQHEQGVRYRYFQYGLVSFGVRGCGGNGTKAAVYANVVQHMDWITSIIS